MKACVDYGIGFSDVALLPGSSFMHDELSPDKWLCHKIKKRGMLISLLWFHFLLKYKLIET